MAKTPKGKGRSARRALERTPVFRGWKTTDQEEIQRRRLRASLEPVTVERLEPQQAFYGTYRTRSPNGAASYVVEIRSLTELNNSCECPDYRVNGLGTCKHIEAVLSGLRDGQTRSFARAAREGSPRIEVFLSAAPVQEIRVSWPGRESPEAGELLEPFFSSSGVLLADPVQALPAMKRALAGVPEKVRSQIRIARDVEQWVADLRASRERLQAREKLGRAF